MALMEGEVPERRWELSAPESGVLLWGPQTRDGEALKLALLELVVRRALRLVAVRERRFLFFPKRTDVLVSGTLYDRPSGRPLRAAIEVSPRLRTYPEGIVGAPVADWARAAVERHRALGGYVQAEVLPALAERGFFGQEAYRRLGLFGATRWVLTSEGRSELADLRALLATGRGALGEWMQVDPARAQVFVEMAGAALLLLPERFPEFRRRRRLAQDGGVDGGTVVLYGDAGRVEERPEDGGRPEDQEPRAPDADVFDFDLDALGDVFGPGSFDGIDAAFDAIDGGVDSGGGGDGGGDGE